MKVFTIQITKESLPLITLLNKGVAPEIENGWTNFLFEMSDDGVVGVREIVKYSDFMERYGSVENYRDFIVADITRSALKGL